MQLFQQKKPWFDNISHRQEHRQLLLKSMRLIQAEENDFNRYAAFMGNKKYQKARRE